MWNLFNSKFHFEKCPDGTRRMVYNSIDDAFPIYCKNFSSRYKAEFDAINEAKASLSADNKSRIHELLLMLDKNNARMQLQFRSAYADYQTDACGKSDHLSREIQKITERENDNRQHQLFMDNMVLLKKSGFSDTAINNIIKESRSLLSGLSISENILAKLSQVTKAIDTWQEEKHE